MESEASASKSNHGYLLVALAFVIMSVMWGAFYAFGVFFKPMLGEFGWTRAATAGAFSICSVIQGLVSIVMGRLNDRYGPRVVMTVSGFLLGLGYCLMYSTQSLWHLYAYYGFIVGIGMGGSFVPLVSSVAKWFVERRGTMTGIVAAAVGVGAFVGPPVASRLISRYGWRVSYLLLGGASFLVIVLCAQFLKQKPDPLSHTTTKEEREGKRQDSPSLSLREAYRTVQFWVFFLMIVCLGFCVFALMVHIVPHALEIGMNPISAANILATIGVFSIGGKILFGKLGDTTGSTVIFIIAFALLSASLFWLIPAGSPWALYLFAAVFGFAYGGGVTSESPLVAELFGLKNHGIILGNIAFSFTLGGAIGPFVAGYMFDRTNSYSLAFLVCAIISCAGLMSACVIRAKRTAS